MIHYIRTKASLPNFFSIIIISFFGFFLIPFLVSGQDNKTEISALKSSVPDWQIEMYKENPDPGLVNKLYDAYYTQNPFVKNTHTQYYKRWMHSYAREDKRTSAEDRTYLDLIRKSSSSRSITSNWASIGPYDWDHSAAGRSYAPGSAHVYTVEQSISNPNILYAGTANSGLWKTLNKGLNWTPLTRDLLISTVYAIEIDFTNPDIVYASMFNSIYKSTNGGTTFLPTGNASFQSTNLDVRDMRLSPSSSTKLFACTNGGLYRTDDGGSNWILVVSGDFQEIEFHPSNSSIIYAVRATGNKTEFYKSIDSGVSFAITGANWPSPISPDEQKRTEISVSPANPNAVYAHCSGEANGGSGLYGVYVSTDQGANWTFKCCGPQPAGPPSLSNPNLMAWSDAGTDDGGQYYYDMGFAVSPTNADSIFLSGVNMWVSGNGGTSFTCPAKWSHPDKPNYVHADIHDIHYYNHSKELWAACDGGIFYSNDNGANFQKRNIGITGTDFWGYGQGWWYGDVMLGGAYHNGTLLKEENVYQNDWLCTDGGDGTLGFVNPGYDRQVYSWFDIKNLQSNRNIAPATRSFNYKPNNTYTTGKSNDLLIDPRYYGHWLTGNGTKLYKTTDNGYNYQLIYDFGADLAAMTQSWSNPDVLYVCTFPDWSGVKRIYRSENAGTSWTEITPTSAQINGNTWIPYDIEVDYDDPMKVWITRTSMYDSNINGYTVFSSSNGGTTWQNISGTGLNGHSPTSMTLQKGTNGGIYIGTRRAVFYKNQSMPDWQLFNTGLPAKIHSVKLEPYYRKQKIRNATDRSIWESELNEPSLPKAQPSMQTKTLECIRDTAFFVDHSVVSDQNVTWAWTFEGGSPSTSNLRNPKITYTSPGSFDVSLTVSDDFGTSTKTISEMIVVNNECSVDTIPGKALVASGTNKHGLVSNFGMNAVDSLTITAWIKPNGIQPDYAAIFMGEGTNAAGFNFKNGNNSLAYHWPNGAWWWDSNIIVPANQWSFVAFVVKATGITVYCNEQSASHNFTLTPTDIPGFRIGSYKGWSDRNMNGMIDEMAIYDRPLSTSEIRELRHLTKVPDQDTSLIAYYQFNALSQNDFDKVGMKHVSLLNGATKVTSRIPVGAGYSKRLTVNSGGLKDFTVADVKMFFPTTGTYPNGELVVTKINQLPETTPTAYYLPKSYWVINNYGTNTTFSVLDSIHFYDSGNISGGCESFYYNFHKRAYFAEGDTWGSTVDFGDFHNPYPPSQVTFSTGNNITTDGQYIVVRNNKIPNENVHEICNGIDDDCDGLIDEDYSLIVTNKIDNGINSLRMILNCAQNSDVILFDVDTIILNSPLSISKSISLLDANGVPVVILSDLNQPGFNNGNFGIRIETLAQVSMENIQFLQQNNTITKPLILNEGELTLKNCILKGDPDPILKNQLSAIFKAVGIVEMKN